MKKKPSFLDIRILKNMSVSLPVLETGRGGGVFFKCESRGRLLDLIKPGQIVRLVQSNGSKRFKTPERTIQSIRQQGNIIIVYI